MQPLLVGAKREGAIKALPRGVYIKGEGIGWYGNDTMDVWVSAFMEREKEKNMMNMTCSAPVLPRTPERVRG